MNVQNVTPTKKSYFYTVLFLNNYYPTVPENSVVQPETKVFPISNDSNSSTTKWLSDTTLWVRHNLNLPLTIKMTDAEGITNLYCPILTNDITPISGLTIESNFTLTIDFSEIEKPKDNEVFKLAMRSLPLFDLNEQTNTDVNLPLDERENAQTGLAIVFRRNSLDSLFDLLADFDETYWHSMSESYDLKYLTKNSCYKDSYFSTKFTNDLQEILDLVDTSKFNIKYSWENQQNNNPIYL